MIRLETGLATYRVVITGHITTQSYTVGEKDDPGEWDMSALMAGLEDGCCEVTECVELLTTEESADLQEEVREARSDIEGQAKIIQDLRDRMEKSGDWEHETLRLEDELQKVLAKTRLIRTN